MQLYIHVGRYSMLYVRVVAVGELSARVQIRRGRDRIETFFVAMAELRCGLANEVS